MIIEFFGVPGGGKTQLLRQLVATMPDAREALATTRRGIARGALLFALQHSISFVVWMGELLTHSNGLLRYKLGLLLRTMAACSLAEKNNDSFATFIDEGFLQRILTIFDTPLTARHINFILKMTPLPDQVVVIHGGEFGRFTTASNRHNSPRVRGGEEKLQAWMKNMRANAAMVEEVLPQYTKVVVVNREQQDAELVVHNAIISQVSAV